MHSRKKNNQNWDHIFISYLSHGEMDKRQKRKPKMISVSAIPWRSLNEYLNNWPLPSLTYFEVREWTSGLCGIWCWQTEYSKWVTKNIVCVSLVVVFAMGSKMYRKPPPEGNIVAQVIKCIWVSSWIARLPFSIKRKYAMLNVWLSTHGHMFFSNIFLLCAYLLKNGV